METETRVRASARLTGSGTIEVRNAKDSLEREPNGLAVKMDKEEKMPWDWKWSYLRCLA